MTTDSRLNLLITHVDKPHAGAVTGTLESTPWYKTLAHLLAPLGVKTFETSHAERALSLIETAPIHLAVVDTRLSALEGLDVLRMIQKMRERAAAQRPAPPPSPPKEPPGFRVEVKLEQQPTGKRVEVKFVAGAVGSRKPIAPSALVPDAPEPEAAWPAVILLTPHRNEAILHQAMALSAFSVVSEPVDLNLMLELMARVLKRFHQNQWPKNDA